MLDFFCGLGCCGLLVVPDLPGGFGLCDEYVEAVAGGGSLLFSLFEEGGFGGIVGEVEEGVLWCEVLVGDGWVLVGVGVGAEWCGVDDECVCGDELWGDLVVGDCLCGFCS